MPITVKSIQVKILEKMEQKFKGGATPQRIIRAFEDADRDKDGFLMASEFRSALSALGSAVSDEEANFLFHFWDTLAETQEPQGAVEIGIAVRDLMSSVPSYGGAFNSGDDGFKNKGAKGNLPSQEGGIFGGGAYSADAYNEVYAPPSARPTPAQSAYAPPESQRPRGNQSSIAGGIFGGESAVAAAPPPPSSGAGGNKSNKSSIAGGIFGEAAPIAAPAQKARYSNQSSIPGGIFG